MPSQMSRGRTPAFSLLFHSKSPDTNMTLLLICTRKPVEAVMFRPCQELVIPHAHVTWRRLQAAAYPGEHQTAPEEQQRRDLAVSAAAHRIYVLRQKTLLRSRSPNVHQLCVLRPIIPRPSALPPGGHT